MSSRGRGVCPPLPAAGALGGAAPQAAGWLRPAVSPSAGCLPPASLGPPAHIRSAAGRGTTQTRSSGPRLQREPGGARSPSVSEACLLLGRPGWRLGKQEAWSWFWAAFQTVRVPTCLVGGSLGIFEKIPSVSFLFVSSSLSGSHGVASGLRAQTQLRGSGLVRPRCKPPGLPLLPPSRPGPLARRAGQRSRRGGGAAGS